MSGVLACREELKKEVGFRAKLKKEKDIREIVCVSTKEVNDFIIYKYRIGNDTFRTIVSKENHHVRSTEINVCSEKDEFVNGYKVVKTNTGGYSFRREIDNLLLGCRFDIATNFNEHGLAMVARDGKVTWMNKNYELLNIEGEFVPYKDVIDKPEEFGFQGVSSFSKGDIALSRVVDRNTKILSKENSTVSFGFAYVKPNGKYKVFHKYDGDNLENYKTINFEKGYGVDFDEKGYAIGANYIIFASGGYVLTDNLRDIAKKEFFIDIINKQIDKEQEENKTKLYKKDVKPKFIRRDKTEV